MNTICTYIFMFQMKGEDKKNSVQYPQRVKRQVQTLKKTDHYSRELNIPKIYKIAQKFFMMGKICTKRGGKRYKT